MIPKVKDTVHAPADRGDKPYTGNVVHVGDTKCLSHQNAPFVWATVRHPSGTEHVWPSNRIGYTLTDSDLAKLKAAPAPGPTPPAPVRRARP